LFLSSTHSQPYFILIFSSYGRLLLNQNKFGFIFKEIKNLFSFGPRPRQLISHHHAAHAPTPSPLPPLAWAHWLFGSCATHTAPLRLGPAGGGTPPPFATVPAPPIFATGRPLSPSMLNHHEGERRSTAHHFKRPPDHPPSQFFSSRLSSTPRAHRR
jgi:hypothetical protein